MVAKHLEGILPRWKKELTTAFLEGLNSFCSANKRKAKGYGSSKYLLECSVCQKQTEHSILLNPQKAPKNSIYPSI